MANAMRMESTEGECMEVAGGIQQREKTIVRVSRIETGTYPVSEQASYPVSEQPAWQRGNEGGKSINLSTRVLDR
jgi:hypothetical protein